MASLKHYMQLKCDGKQHQCDVCEIFLTTILSWLFTNEYILGKDLTSVLIVEMNSIVHPV